MTVEELIEELKKLSGYYPDRCYGLEIEVVDGEVKEVRFYGLV